MAAHDGYGSYDSFSWGLLVKHKQKNNHPNPIQLLVTNGDRADSATHHSIPILFWKCHPTSCYKRTRVTPRRRHGKSKFLNTNVESNQRALQRTALGVFYRRERLEGTEAVKRSPCKPKSPIEVHKFTSFGKELSLSISAARGANSL